MKQFFVSRQLLLRGICLAVLTLSPVYVAAKEKVIVIGAGLAGLNSAMLLEERGFEVTVLEARQRIGGRLYTLDEVPGSPEAGGNVIGPAYARILDRARQMQLNLVPATDIVGGREAMQLYVDGKFIDSAQWPSVAVNPFPGKLKSVPPGSALFAVTRPNPLQRPEDWLLQEHSASDLPVSGLMSKLGFDQRARQLINNNNSYGSSLKTTNLLQLYHIAAVYSLARNIPGAPMAIEGGNQRLPEAMAKALAGTVLTGKVVRSISGSKDGVVVRCVDGSQYRAAYAIAAVPFTALRNIEITPALPEPQQQAIDELNYAQTLLAQFTVSSPYWGEQSPSLWTDTPAGRLFATARNESGEVSNLTMWITGANAESLGAMGQSERDKALHQALYDIYPQARGAVKLESVVDWGADPFSGGTWAAWLPGQVARFINVMSRPAGRLYFAGEHTAVTNTGMEGAMESAERAVGELLKSRSEYAGASLFLQCQGCHSVKAGEADKLGPNLAGFFGRPAASRAGYDYSGALQQSGLVWDREQLRKWLTAPQALVPGNRMVYQNAYTSQELEQLLGYLAGLRQNP